jgi:hypothetical protein
MQGLGHLDLVKIRYDKRFVKKNLKIFFPPRFCRGKGNSSSLSYNSAVITRTASGDSQLLRW